MKERLDVLLVQRGLAPSREKAKVMIMEGNVFVAGQREDKAGTSFDEKVEIEVRGNTLKYVSQGGLKLEKAMANFGISLEDRICMDIGASTGGFTDCMLQNGAKSICGRCGIWTVCVEASPGSAGGLYGKDKYPLCDPGGYCRCSGFCFGRCIFYFSYQSIAGSEGTADRAWRNGVSYQAAV